MLFAKNFQLHNWCEVAWKAWKTVDYQELVNGVVRKENIHNLSQILKKNESNTFEWLDSLGTFLLEDYNNLLLIQKNPITPNQNGQFKRIARLVC